jgi:hypothetical protein
LRDFLEQQFDKDTGRRGGLIFIEMDDRDNLPSNGISSKKMAKELRNNSQLVGLVTMDCFVVFNKAILEKLLPETIELTESFPDVSVEFIERLLLI